MTSTTDTPLMEFCERYYCAAAHQRSGRRAGAGTKAAMRSICSKLHMMLGRVPIVSDLNGATLERYLGLLTESQYTSKTIESERQFYLSHWRFAADIGLIPIDDEHRGKKGRSCHHDEQGNALALSEAEGTLWHYCLTVYFKKNIRIRSTKTQAQYAYSLLDLKQCLGHDPTPADLTDDNVAAVMKMLLDKGYAGKTVNERGSRLKALWTWLARRRVVNEFPTVQRIKSPRRIPRAYNREQLDKLFEACQHMGGKVGRVWAADFWQGLLGTAWDSGERIGALMQLRWEWLDATTGDVIIPAEARKGQERDMAYRLHADTLAVLQRLRVDGSDLIFDWPYNDSTLFNHYKRLRRLAGLPEEKRTAFHKIRRSVASHLQAAGHSACDALGHSTPAVTRDSYLDPRIVSVASRPSEVLFRPGKPPATVAVAAPVTMKEPVVELDPSLAWL